MLGLRFPLAFLVVCCALFVTFVGRSALAEETTTRAHEALAPAAAAPEDRHGVPIVTRGNAAFCVLGSLASFVLQKPPQRDDVVTTVVANASAKTIAPSAMAMLAVRF